MRSVEPECERYERVHQEILMSHAAQTSRLLPGCDVQGGRGGGALCHPVRKAALESQHIVLRGKDQGSGIGRILRAKGRREAIRHPFLGERNRAAGA